MSQPTVATVGASTPTVVTCGADMFADSVAGQAVDVERVDWRPPMPAPRPTSRRSPPIPAAPTPTAARSRRCSASRPTSSTSRPPPRCSASRRDSSSTPGPPIEWARASGPLRGALMGGAALEGLVDDPEDAVALFESGSSVSLEPCHHRSAVGPMAGVVTPSMWMWVLEDRATGAPDVLLPQRGPRQGAALRRLRARGAHPAALDGRRARPPAAGRRARHREATDVTGILTQMLQMGDEAHNRNRAGTLMLLRDLSPALVAAGPTPGSTPDVADVLRFVGGNDHFFLNLGDARVQARARRRSRRRRARRWSWPWRATAPTSASRSPAPATSGSPVRPRWPRASSSATTAPTTPTPTSATPPSPRPPASAASRWRPPRRSSASSAGPCPTRWPPPGGCTRSRSRRTPAGRCPSWSSWARPPASTCSKVCRTGILPQINTGMAGKVAGVGQVGAGLVTPPAEIFPKALAALAVRAGQVEEAGRSL